MTSLFMEKKAVGQPSVTFDVDLFLKDVKTAVESKMLTNGGIKVQEFEQQISQRILAKNVICVCNATIGLQVALKALNITGQVIVPSFTFVATAHACNWIGLEVLFCDIDPKTLLMDTVHLKKLIDINPSVSAVIPVHVYGRACNYIEIEKIAKIKNLKVIYDAAHAFGSKYDEFCYVGSKGDCEVFSFHATKSLSSMEGGAITTNDNQLAEKIRRIINFGFSGYDNVTETGNNAKMCEVAAIYGLQSLSGFERLSYHNLQLHQEWKRLFQQKAAEDTEWSHFIRLLDGDSLCNMHYSVVLFKKNHSNIDRNLVHETLLKKNVHTRKYFFPGVHQMPAYKLKTHMSLPNTELIAEEVLCFPTGYQMSISDVQAIFKMICELWDTRI